MTCPTIPSTRCCSTPGELSRIYIGTDLGVFSSTGGGGWVRLGEGLPMVAVFDLAVEPAAGVMVAATHGRGAFALPVAAPLVAETRGERRVVVARGGDPVEGGAPVRIYGTGWPEARWEARAPAAGWLELTRAQGGALDSVGWRIDPGDLPPGEYVDTVTVVVAGAGAVAEFPGDGAGGAGGSRRRGRGVGGAAGSVGGAGREHARVLFGGPLHRGAGRRYRGGGGFRRGGGRRARARAGGVARDPWCLRVARADRLGRHGPGSHPVDTAGGGPRGRPVPGHHPGRGGTART